MRNKYFNIRRILTPLNLNYIEIITYIIDLIVTCFHFQSDHDDVLYLPEFDQCSVDQLVRDIYANLCQKYFQISADFYDLVSE